MSHHQGWLHPTHCGHHCCNTQDNHWHSHTHLPGECRDCRRVWPNQETPT